MARLQILELPEGDGDDRPPFLLVLDQADEATADDIARWPSNIAERTGARHVLVFEGTVDIPANDTSAYLRDGDSRPEFVVELTGPDPQRATGAQLAQERTDIARDMDRLANHKTALLDALGMDRTRDWDDIRNAAAGIRKERDEQAETLDRVRGLHGPVEHRGQIVCLECSAWSGGSTDNAPVAHEQCSTLRVLSGEQLFIQTPNGPRPGKVTGPPPAADA